MGLKAQKQQALATWLSTSHRMKLGSGAFVNVPNFIFPLEEVVWQDGRGGKGNRVDEEKVSDESDCCSTATLNAPCSG